MPAVPAAQGRIVEGAGAAAVEPSRAAHEDAQLRDRQLAWGGQRSGGPVRERERQHNPADAMQETAPGPWVRVQAMIGPEAVSMVV